MHGLRVQARKLTATQSHQYISYHIKSNTEKSNNAVRELALEKYTLCPKKVPTFKLSVPVKS